MLAKIETIQQFESAVQWMKSGQTALQVGLLLTLLLLGLSVLSIFFKDERLAHAARRGQYALLALTAFCCTLLYVGIFEGWYFVGYIQAVTENNEVVPFKISALWASQQGSLLFWCLILTGFGGAFAFSQRHNRTDRRLPYIMAVLAVIQFFFFFILVSPFDPEAAQRSSPFALSFFWLSDPDFSSVTLHAAAAGQSGVKATQDGWALVNALVEAGKGDWTLARTYFEVTNRATQLPAGAQTVLLDQVSDGSGMNPNLHNYWIAIHPPMLYLGFVGFTIPFAYAVGSLLSGEVSEGWLKPIRLWTMASWGFLTVGIALGGLWAYEILGWGGYWAWDPVENASFIPWLTGTAFIHSVIVTERRGMLRGWSFALIIITYCMTVIGTFLVRSGVLNSVHAFGATGDVDLWFYGFIAVVFMGSLLALIWRAPLLKSDRKLENLLSREGSFLFNNLILLAIALVTLVVTFWPLITKGLYGESGSEELGQDAFVLFNAPLFLAVLWLMGAGPALAWRRNNGRQLLRAFAPPTAAALVVGVVNFIWLNSNDLIVQRVADDSIASLSGLVRQGVQLTLWPICAFTLVCIFMEFVAGARARKRGTGENMAVAMARVTLANRRRYGGYIVHLGILLVALGIYYSSIYEAEGSMTAHPGGYSILQDKLTGDRFLVYYESEQRTSDWDFLRDKFGMDEQRAQTYNRMLEYVRKNPDKSADEIVAIVRKDAERQFGGELPEFFVQNALPGMIAAVAWGVQQRDNKDVYESFDTTLRIFSYQPAQPQVESYLKAHARLQDLLFGDTRTGGKFDDRAVALLLVRLQVRELMAAGGDLRGLLMDLRRALRDSTPEQLAGLTRLDLFGVSADELDFAQLRPALLERMDEVIAALDAVALEGVKLGPEQLEVNRGIREGMAGLPREKFAQTFGFDPADEEAYAARRFEALKDLGDFNDQLTAATTARRNELVAELAARIQDAGAREQLEALRPLSLTGLQRARKSAEGEKLAAIDAEIAAILADAATVEPRMRIFYDKRSGAPRMQEPVKDPYYHRTLGKDTYFILQDAQPDGRATFRYFVKPQMTLGLSGLVITILGTVLAILPSFRRRRPEVA
ncbi:MAG: heme lyase CcmF/NrfE family subunit [Planctomycetes bacterium]|nr:heme lyase CcmF/NrfE family subunit [Planctomycetota bacterium]MCB9935131.1 heme lyase CcmF/NrfE family subunit [Planctomycetota bacterium]